MDDRETRERTATLLLDSLGLPPFAPPLLLRSGYLQTALSAKRHPKSQPNCDHASVVLDFDDGTGDQTQAEIFRPTAGDTSDPVIVFFHGLGGNKASHYQEMATATLVSAGLTVVRPDFRGAGDSGPLAREYHHPGRWEDVSRILTSLCKVQPALADRSFVLVGTSMGGHVLLKFLADSDEPLPILGGITVSAPLSLERASRNLSRPTNLPIGAYLLRKLRREICRPNGVATEAQVKAACSAKTIWQLDKRFTAPLYGCDSIEQFYAEMSALDELERIRIPTVCIHADDDPFVSTVDYENPHFADNQRLQLILQDNGGHGGFFKSLGSNRWVDDVIVALVKGKFWL